ncbi:MAG: Gfo/Idh/MocA family oxidoreductase [Actinomycetota bacterium]
MTSAGSLPAMLLSGFGNRGRLWHEEIRRSGLFRLTGVVDPQPAAMEEAAGAGIAAWPDIERALEAGGFDGAIIASPPLEHVAQSLACLRAGLGVLIEKPLAPSVADGQEVAAAAAGAGLPALVVQNFRFRPRELSVRKALTEGSIGEVVATTIASVWPPPGVSRPQHDKDQGKLWDACLHHIDSLRVRFGGAPATVRCEMGSRSGYGDDWSLSAVMDWEAGPRAVYHHSENSPGLFHYVEVLEGSRGTLTIQDETVTVWLPGRRGKRVRPSKTPGENRVLLEAFGAGLRGTPARELGIDDNLQTIATLEAMTLSAAERREVKLSEVLAGDDG